MTPIRVKAILASILALAVALGLAIAVSTLSRPAHASGSVKSSEKASAPATASGGGSANVAGTAGATGATGGVSTPDDAKLPTPSPGANGICKTPCNQDFLTAAADQARAIAGREYFTGVTIDTDANKVNLYLAHAPRSVIEEIEAKHPGVYVFHPAEHTWAEVMKLMHSVAASGNSLRASGIVIYELGPTQDGHLVIGVDKKNLEVATSKLNAMFGADWIRVIAATQATLW